MEQIKTEEQVVNEVESQEAIEYCMNDVEKTEEVQNAVSDKKTAVVNLLWNHKKEIGITAGVVLGGIIVFKVLKKKKAPIDKIQEVYYSIPENVDKLATAVCDGIPKDEAEKALEMAIDEVTE